MTLETELPAHGEQRRMGQVLQLEVGIERPRVVGAAAGLPVAGRQRGGKLRQPRRADAPGERDLLDGRRVGLDAHPPVAVRRAVGGHARRAVDGADLGAWIGDDRGGVERRVLDLVAHPDHLLLAHRLDVHQRAAVRQPELAAAIGRAR